MEPEEPGEGITRKGDILRAASRISAAGGGAYLAKILGPGAGAAVAQVLAEAGEPLVGALEKWELRRIHRTLQRFKDQVDSRVSAGETLRAEIADPESPGAIPLFESVVEAAARSIEEKKCDVIANFYAAAAFDDDISIHDALLYLRRMRASSWRQLVALRYFEDDGRAEERELIGAAGAEGDARIHPALGIELSEAARGLELIGIGQQGGTVANPSNVMDGGQITSQSAARIRATGLGETVSRLGRIGELVSPGDLDAIAHDLRSDQRPASSDESPADL